jgi:hypothetical protein
MILRWLRCFTIQGIAKAILWIVLLGGTGYAAMKSSYCSENQTCAQATQMKARK